MPVTSYNFGTQVTPWPTKVYCMNVYYWLSLDHSLDWVTTHVTVRHEVLLFTSMKFVCEFALFFDIFFPCIFSFVTISQQHEKVTLKWHWYESLVRTRIGLGEIFFRLLIYLMLARLFTHTRIKRMVRRNVNN